MESGTILIIRSIDLLMLGTKIVEMYDPRLESSHSFFCCVESRLLDYTVSVESAIKFCVRHKIGYLDTLRYHL